MTGGGRSRRKQFCPQKTGGPDDEDEEAGSASAAATDTATEAPMAESTDEGGKMGGGDEDDVGRGVTDGEDEDEVDVVGNKTKEDEEGVRRKSSDESSSTSLPPPLPAGGAGGKELAEMLRTNPLLQLQLNPALLTVNPQLYAVQLAQLQAGLQQLQAAAAAAAAASSNPAMAALSNGSQNGSPEKAPMDLAKSTSPRPPKPESPLDLSKSPPSGFPGATVSSSSWPPRTGLNLLLQKQQEVLRAKQASPPSSAPAAAFHPYFAAAAAAAAQSQHQGRNPLERMSEIVRHPASSPSSSAATTTPPPSAVAVSPRQSAWQSQWRTRGPGGATADVFKCVCCGDRFNSLQDLTAHMRMTGHFAGPTSSSSSPAPQSTTGRAPVRRSPPFQLKSAPSSASSPSGTASSSPSKPGRDLLKEPLPMPRKLVRGQDVWLGKGEEQTKNILKCMYCAQSFRSLEALTQHMQETKHYTKVISQEQISTWKGSGSPPPAQQQQQQQQLRASPSRFPATSSSSPNGSESLNNVLSCIACGDNFPTLKLLTEHIIKTGHHHHSGKAPPAPSFPFGKREASEENVGPPSDDPPGPPPPSKKSKSLPVKTLLEMERNKREQVQRLIQRQQDAERTPCARCGEQVPLTAIIIHGMRCEGRLSGPPPAMPSPPSPSPSSSVSPPTSDAPPPPPSAASNNPSSSFKSILGSLESMVHGSKKQPAVRPAGIKSVEEFLHRPPSGSADRPKTTSPLASSSTGTTSPPSFPLRTAALAATPSEEAAKKSSGGHNPLAALQQLCESAEKKPAMARTTTNGSASTPTPSSSSSSTSPPSRARDPTTTTPAICDPTSIVAFSWACNQAAAAAGGGFKCPFCETPFTSKGAYRHHLSKVHFVKDSDRTSEEKPSSTALPTAAAATAKSVDTSEAKYHKYAELAKQLSSGQPTPQAQQQAKPPMSTLA